MTQICPRVHFVVKRVRLLARNISFGNVRRCSGTGWLDFISFNCIYLTLSLQRLVNFACSFPRNITPHSMKNLVFHNLVLTDERWLYNTNSHYHPVLKRCYTEISQQLAAQRWIYFVSAVVEMWSLHRATRSGQIATICAEKAWGNSQPARQGQWSIWFTHKDACAREKVHSELLEGCYTVQQRLQVPAKARAGFYFVHARSSSSSSSSIFFSLDR